MKIDSVSSSTNPKFKIWRSLLSSKGIREEKLCIVSGSKITKEVMNNGRLKISCALLPNEDEINSYRSLNQVFTLSADIFKELDTFGTHAPLLVVETPNIDLYVDREPQGLEVVVPFSDPSNIGAVIRSCVAFGVSKIILTQESANPFLPKALRASAGASLLAPLVLAPKLESLASHVTVANTLFALDMKGQALDNFKWPQNVRLIVGEEGQGLPEDFKFVTRLSIPIQDQTDSLNAVVASSVALFSYRSQRK